MNVLTGVDMSEITNKELAEYLKDVHQTIKEAFGDGFFDKMLVAAERLAAMPDEIEPWKDGWTDWYTGSDGWSHIKTDCLKLHLESIESQSQVQQSAPDEYEHLHKTIELLTKQLVKAERQPDKETIKRAYKAGFIAACKWPSPVTQDVDSKAFDAEMQLWWQQQRAEGVE